MNLKYIIVFLILSGSLSAGIDMPGINKHNGPRWLYPNTHDLSTRLRKLSSDEWPLPGFPSTTKLNDSSEAVLALKQYLKATGDLNKARRSYMSSAVFDMRLEDAVKNFQERHGLDTDGIAGEKTLAEMNVPACVRMNQVQASIERLNSFPSDPGDRYIIVNIPDFHMEYYEYGELLSDMKVVVGEIENYTPMLHDTMSYIVFNPAWNVPESITMEEIIPAAKDDPGFLERNDYVLLEGSYESQDTISPEDVDWDKTGEGEAPFKVVQMPGEKNSLGKIKFMFPNNLAIYLHDTPADQLFQYDKRAFSHGCIRVEKPFDLASTLLTGQMEPGEIEKILEEEETVSVPLDNKVVVHITYITAWIDDRGRLNFREDIYGLDR